MGREIRRVPKGWGHPSEPMQESEYTHWYLEHHKLGDFGYGLNFTPLYDNDIESAWREWFDGLKLWERGQHPSQIKWPEHYPERTYASYAEYEGRSPDPDSYRSEAWTPAQAICYQIYETVTEGTPVSPVFETLEAMEDWLVNQGHSRQNAKAFCESGYVPSMVVIQHPDGTGTIYTGIDSASIG